MLDGYAYLRDVHKRCHLVAIYWPIGRVRASEAFTFCFCEVEQQGLEPPHYLRSHSLHAQEVSHLQHTTT